MSGDYVIPLFHLPKVWVGALAATCATPRPSRWGASISTLGGRRRPGNLGRMLSCAARTVAHAWGWRPRMPLHRRLRPSIRLAMARAKRVPLSEDLADLPALIVRMRAGERRAISRAVTELERLSAAAPRLLRAMEPHLGHGAGPRLHGSAGSGQVDARQRLHAACARAGQDGRHHRRRPVEPGLGRRHPRRPHPHDGNARRRRRLHALAGKPRAPGRAVPCRRARDRCARCRRQGPDPDRDGRHRAERDRRGRGGRRARASSPRRASATTSRP